MTPSTPDAAQAYASWYVLQSKPQRERVVERQLSDKGLEVFFPCVRVNPVNPRSARVRAYFPGYLFVHLDLAARGEAVRWLPGSVGLLTFGDEPAVVPPALITQLKRRIADIQAAGGLVLAEIKHGDPVKITSGPFAGYEAVFDLRLRGAERVRVLLQLLQRRVPLELDTGAIRKLRDGETSAPREGHRPRDRRRRD